MSENLEPILTSYALNGLQVDDGLHLRVILLFYDHIFSNQMGVKISSEER
jgi:hypothetical protein